jgi:hypothetical protein
VDGGASAPERTRQRGQVVVIFGLAIVLFMGLCALAVDISWYWVNNLRMQRAADAAALAGVVHLPGNVSLATSLALDEATKNGYTNGVGGVVVTPTQDPTNPRRLRVAISGPVSTYFARVFGIASFPARRDAKAEFVLPVPMGSPQNYYGVGFFEGIGAGPAQTVGPNLPTATAAPNGWTNANRAFTSNNQYATNATGAMQGYGTFGLSVPSGNNVLGIEVRVEARSNDATGCRLAVSLSWNNGTSWTSEKFYNLTGSDPSPPVTLGGAADTWGRTWAPTEFANGSFLVRVRDDDPGAACTNTATSSLDALDVRVSYQNPVGGGNQVFPIPDPGGGPALAPQNFWGAVFTSGGIRENGDRYAPAYLGNGAGGSEGDPNPDYDPDGYDYTVEFSGGAANGQIQLFDPMFCATGGNGHGGSYGAGDHWTGDPGPDTMLPVHVSYRLYNMNGTPYDESDDSLVTTLTYDPGSATMGDFSGRFGTPSNSTDVNRQDCSTNPAHNNWGVPGLRPGGRAVSGQCQHHARRREHEHRCREPVLDLGGLVRGRRAGLRLGQDGCLYQPGHDGRVVLPRPDRGRPRGQDDDDHVVRPGRVERQRVPADPDPDQRQQLSVRDLQLGVGRRAVGHQRHPDPDLGRWQRPIQQPGTDDLNPAAHDLRDDRSDTRRRVGAWLVEDRVRDESVERHHDLGSRHHRQSGPTRPSLIQG